MEFFRNITKSLAGRIFMGFVVVVFVAFAFLPSLNPPGSSGEVAVVNGEKIGRGELDQAVEGMMRRFGDQVDRKVLEQLVDRNMVLDRLIHERIMVAAARDAGMVIHPDEIRDAIRDVPAFRGDDGQFSQERFEMVIRQQGIAGAAAFRKLFEEDLLSRQLKSGYVESSFATGQDLDLITRIAEQARDVAWVTVAPEPLMAAMPVSDEEIGKRYESNTTGYMTDERFSVDYIELNALDFGEDIPVAEEDIKAAYEELAAKASRNAERRVAHIFVAINAQRDAAAAEARAKEAINRLAGGDVFPRVAAEFSDDPAGAARGGDLGYLGRGALEPEQDEALFALKVNDVSSPVRSKDGFHIFKVLDVRSVEVPSLAQARAGIIAGLRHDKGLEKYHSAVDELGTTAYEADNLQEPAQTLGLKVQTSPVFSRRGGEGIASYPKVLAELVSPEVLEDGRNSGVIEVEDGHAYVIRLKEHIKPQRRPLAEVAADIRREIQREKAVAEAKRRGDEIMQAVAAGKTIDEAANGLPVMRQGGVQRRGAGVPPEVMTAAFRAKRPAGSAVSPEVTDAADGGRIVVVVSNVVDGTTLGMTPEQVAGNRAEIAVAYGNVDFGNVSAAALAKADVRKIAEPKPGEEDSDFKLLGNLGRPTLPAQ